MICLIIPLQCKQLMESQGLTDAEAITTLNDRHLGVTDDGMTRVAAAHWFSEQRIVMVDGPITKKHTVPDGQETLVSFDEVTAGLVIRLRPDLPAGRINREMDMETVLAVVAESFGVPLRCHPDEPVSTLYSGPWDERTVASFKTSLPNRTYAICGSFSPGDKYCEMVYAFDLERYSDWSKIMKSSLPLN